ncbi:HAMP domain-containing histidine kinase [Companilactobacillus allii]|uniref:sensor histidine kinase n=1 Tax=Companilactobacillus allii TaxID=1847728 RepID=UPI00208EFF46|nr:HAMP domain-containing sensor histidine kinase [Companilactobacillus allii]USQ69538.1 HAMP domain-containing histidine kinase [Companilactobacillus allii]
MQKKTQDGPHGPDTSNEKNNRQPDPQAPFQASILVFSSSGKLLNKTSLGNRYSVLKHIKLNKKNINKKQTLTIKKMSFRALLIKVSKTNNNPMYAGNYVLIMQNIDTQIQAVNNFQKILIITFFIFWIIALILSYVLTRISMFPIIKSWKQQSEFVNDAAHELRTPLTIIQGKLEYMLTKPHKTIIDEAESISVSLDEVNRLNSLTNNLLILARSDQATTKMDYKITTPEFFLKDPIMPFKEIINSQNKVFQVNIHHKNDVKLNVDRDKIKQVLIILLDNATKYTPENGTIRIYDYIDGSKYQIIVSDTGIGISDTDKKKIFGRFYRVDKSRNHNSGGHGLGLAIAQQIINNHHGKIFVRSNLPTGSEFIFELPIKH